MILRPSFCIALRIALCAVPVATSALVIMHDAGTTVDGSKFGEHSATEWLQQTYLLLACLVSILIGIRSKNHRAISYLLGGGAMVALIRELDVYFDKIYHGAWLLPVLLVLALTATAIFKRRNQICDNLGELCSSPALGTFVSGFVGVVIFSRLFGTKSLWKALFEADKLDSMQRLVKTVVQEGTELFGYTLLFIASVEFLIYITQGKPRPCLTCGEEHDSIQQQ
ncbi:MAG: hypothetical protein ABFR47_08000 [Verrucomicrobiota bacterium]